MSNAAETSTGPSPPRLLERIAGVAGLALLAGLAALPAWRPPGPATAAAPTLEPASLEPCGGETRAFLRGRLHGDVDRDIDWTDDGLACGGMLRPRGRGMRLMFAPTAGDRLLFVIGLDATPESLSGAETPANLTIVDEARGRFFSTGERERCWVMADQVEPHQAASGAGYRIAGTLYCMGAVPAVNGIGSLTPGEFRFELPVVLEDE